MSLLEARSTRRVLAACYFFVEKLPETWKPSGDTSNSSTAPGRQLDGTVSWDGQALFSFKLVSYGCLKTLYRETSMIRGLLSSKSGDNNPEILLSESGVAVGS